MPSIVFFKQARVDGGVRSGIDIDGETVLGHYIPGTDAEDPALLWYIDLRFSGASLPHEPAGARKWLLERATPIADALRARAGELRAGVDLGAWPKIHTCQIDGAEMAMAVSAIRRVESRQIPQLLELLGAQWRQEIEALECLSITSA